jgi:hypothetical protein
MTELDRESYAKALKKQALLRLKDPIISKKQKIPAGEEVYISPMYNIPSDVITSVEGTYAQLFGGNNFSSYSTKIAAWYKENQLMPTNGKSIDECRNSCYEYFNMYYYDMLNKKVLAEEKSRTRLRLVIESFIAHKKTKGK